MNAERFKDFKREAKQLITSSEWVNDKIDDLIFEYNSIDSDTDIEVLEELEVKMTELQNKALWEDRQHTQFHKKYKDLLGT